MARSVSQFKMFADLLIEGSWLDARIDLANPNRPGSPKPDIRRTQVPLGPVAVFGASNFPYAFSVAGGDVASALAAGCPVLLKAHPAHPETTEIIAAEIGNAIHELGLDPAVFQVVWGGPDAGAELVLQPEVKAVGFTGSLTAGQAIAATCARRREPIPVYAEMGSVNPVFALPSALSSNAEPWAIGYAQSLTLGVGQFCTNPGILVGLKSPEFDAFLDRIGVALAGTSCGTMLTERIFESFREGVRSRLEDHRLTPVYHEEAQAPSFFSVEAQSLFDDPSIAEELFGPSGIAIQCASPEEMLQVAESLPGQLTASVLFEEEDKELVSRLLPLLVGIAGRVVANSFPTGVEVCPSMHHGGPFPATIDGRSTSVGTAAILRFVRPIAFQNFSDDLLPEELRNKNAHRSMRLVDGELTRKDIPLV